MSYSVHNFSDGDTLFANSLNEMDEQIAANELQAATADTLGGIKVGDGLSITDGVLSAASSGGGVGLIKSTDTFTDDDITTIMKNLFKGVKYYYASYTTTPKASESQFNFYYSILNFYLSSGNNDNSGVPSSLTDTINSITLYYCESTDSLSTITLTYTTPPTLASILGIESNPD